MRWRGISQPERKEYLWSAAIGSYLNECHSKCCYFFEHPSPPPPPFELPLVPEKRNIYSLGTCGLLKQVTFLSFSRLSNSIMIVTGAPVTLREAIHMRHHPDNIIRYSGVENTRACKSTIKKHMRQSVTEAMKEWTSAGRIDDGERKKSNTPVATRIIMFQVVYRCYVVAIKKLKASQCNWRWLVKQTTN